MSVVRASVFARRLLGAGFILLLLGVATAVLAGSGRTFGRGIHVEVEIASTGALKSDAKLKIAGREVGEVRGMHRESDGERHVIIDCFVAREWAPAVRKNSLIFVATPSVLGEAYLEIGPAEPRGSEPGPPVADGDRLRGVDPTEIDRLVQRGFNSMTVIVALLREHRPTVDELLKNGDRLLTTLSGLPADPGQLGRIRDAASRLAEDGLALINTIGDTKAIPRVRAIARDLGDTADRAGPELSSLATRVKLAAARIDALSDLFTPERRAVLSRALESFGHAIDTATAIVKDVREIVARVERGEGSIGAFLQDNELWDDLHATGKTIVQTPWSTIIKPEPFKKR